jgi:hypothetical protein
MNAILEGLILGVTDLCPRNSLGNHMKDTFHQISQCVITYNFVKLLPKGLRKKNVQVKYKTSEFLNVLLKISFGFYEILGRNVVISRKLCTPF